MGLFDSYSEGSFKKLRDGRTAFYPHLLGRGYVVSDEQRAVLSRFITRWSIIVLAVVVFLSAFGTFFMLLGGSLVCAVYYGRLRWLTKKLERAPADERLTLRGRYGAQAQQVGWTTLFLVEIVFVVFTLASLYIIVTSKNRYSLLAGLACMVFSGLGSWAGGYMLWVKRSSSEA